MERKQVGFRFLSEPDMIKAGVLDVKKCVEVMDDTFKLLGAGDFVMGGYNQSSHGCMLWYPMGHAVSQYAGCRARQKVYGNAGLYRGQIQLLRREMVRVEYHKPEGEGASPFDSDGGSE